MLTLSAGMETKRLQKTGTSPVWVMKFKFATGDCYVGDWDMTIHENRTVLKDAAGLPRWITAAPVRM